MSLRRSVNKSSELQESHDIVMQRMVQAGFHGSFTIADNIIDALMDKVQVHMEE